MTEINIC